MKQFFFWCYPWDIVDEGVEAALGRMAGEIGVNAVSVATTCREVTAFRSRAVFDRRTVRQAAAAHFQPDEKCYVRTRIRPNTASWIKSRNPLEKIARIAEQEDLKLRAWTTCCDSTSLAARHPMAACVDVFGEASPHRLCPSNADVREYIPALVEDLTTNYPVEAVELVEAHFGRFPDGRGRVTEIGVAPGEVGSALLSWCFCSSCRQRASDREIDVDAVVASVNEHLGRMMRVEPAAFDSLDSLCADDDVLAAYHAMRAEAVTSLVGLAHKRCQARLVLHGGAPAPSIGVDVAGLSQQCDGFIMSYGPEGVVARGAAAVEAAGGAGRIETAHRCYPPDLKDSATLVARVHQAAQAGYAGMGFFNYGLAPEPCLDWVRQAVRFARRETLA